MSVSAPPRVPERRSEGANRWIPRRLIPFAVLVVVLGVGATGTAIAQSNDSPRDTSSVTVADRGHDDDPVRGGGRVARQADI